MLCLQLRCEQSRVLLWFPELGVLMRKEADSASACESIRAALQDMDLQQFAEAYTPCMA